MLPISLLLAAVATPGPLSVTVADPLTQAPKVLQGVLSAPLTGELGQATRAWALAQREALKVPKDADLRVGPGFLTRFGASVHLVEQVDGVDVEGAQVVVTLDAQRRVVLVTSSLLPVQQVVRDWRVAGEEALQRAAKTVRFALVKNGRTPGGARKAYFAVGEALHSGWLTYVPTADVRDNWLVAVDATTGEILWSQNRVFHAALDANAYAPSPGGLDAGVGVTSTVKVSLTHADGGPMVVPNDGGFLVGTQLDALNCCVNQDCSLAPDAGMRRAKGQLSVMGFSLYYDSVVCDRRQLATNDPAVHDGGSYEYTPFDPPTATPKQSDPASVDEFSEVHAFYQVNTLYDWVRGLSRAAAPIFPGHQPALTPFSMRDERRQPARKPAVWANVVFPDLQEVASKFPCGLSQSTPCTIDHLGHIDNAAFMPRENFAQIPVPEYQMDVDTLMIFQGAQADFGYDAPVLWHEFGHGVIYSTANLALDALALDSLSANNEGGALHEGLADFIAGAYGQNSRLGTYVGPRIGGGGQVIGVRNDAYLRNLDNTFACPDVLWGEVHQDSQHVSGALWQARSTLFSGNDQGATFDAAFYAALVSLAPSADFASFAAAMSQHVATAFPTVANADQKLTAIFTQRGVIGCSKVLDFGANTPARPLFGIAAPGGGLAQGTLVPGPFQFRLAAPKGASAVTLSAKPAQTGSPLGGAPQVKVLAKAGTTIRFTKMGTGLTNDADKVVDATANQTSVSATVPLTGTCDAGFIYVALGSQAGANLSTVKLSLTEDPACSFDGGSGAGGGSGGSGGGTGGSGGSAGGGSGTDGGMNTTMLPNLGIQGGAAAKGCGCGSAELGGLSIVAALALLRRRRAQS
ncbi:MAG: hypothetical protein K1X89_24845 [Myxococcaceae bacterium]|nr:hypothetical protein [Myxococcaceae bacterium]